MLRTGLDGTKSETQETLNALLEEKKIIEAKIEGVSDANFVRVEELSLSNLLRSDFPEHSFIRILFNDDALLLGYHKRLKDYFGHLWRYPQLSEGIVWRAAVLHGRQLIGEAIVDMHAESRFFKVRKLKLHKEFAGSEMSSKIEDEFMRHAEFQGKTLEIVDLRLI